MIAREGALGLLAELLAAGEDWLLCMASLPIAQAEDDSAAKYVAAEATFPGYARKRVARGIGPGSWGAPTLADPVDPAGMGGRGKVAASRHGVEFVWTIGPDGADVTGWFLLGADSGLLIAADALDCPFRACPGGKSFYTPYIEFG